MNNQLPTEMQQAAAALVERFAKDPTPFISALRYFDQLGTDPNSNAGETSEMRLQVIRGLLEKMQPMNSGQ